MRKKLIVILLMLCLALSLAACASGESGGQSSRAQELTEAQSGEVSSQEESETPEPEESEAPETEQSGDAGVSDEVLKEYHITADDFQTLKAILDKHISDEWTEEEAYGANLYGVCLITIPWALEMAHFMDAPEYTEKYADSVEAHIQSALENISRDENVLDYGYMREYLGYTQLDIDRADIFGHAVIEWVQQQDFDSESFIRFLSSFQYEAINAGEGLGLEPFVTSEFADPDAEPMITLNDLDEFYNALFGSWAGSGYAEVSTPTEEESDGEEEVPDGAVSEGVLSNYGLTAEEFEALREAISAQIQEEWTADEAYDSNLNGINSWLGYGGAADYVGVDFDGTLMTVEGIDEYIEKNAKYWTEQDPLFQERAMVLGHALIRWAADNGMSTDKWEDVWSGLQVAFWEYCYEENPNDKYIKPLFSPEN